MGTKKGMRRKTARRAYEDAIPKKKKKRKPQFKTINGKTYPLYDTPLMRLFGLDK